MKTNGNDIFTYHYAKQEMCLQKLTRAYKTFFYPRKLKLCFFSISQGLFHLKIYIIYQIKALEQADLTVH